MTKENYDFFMEKIELAEEKMERWYIDAKKTLALLACEITKIYRSENNVV